MTTNTEQVVKEILTRLEPIVESIVFRAVQKHTQLDEINLNREYHYTPRRDANHKSAFDDEAEVTRSKPKNNAHGGPTAKIRSGSIADRIMHIIKDVKSIEIAKLAEMISESVPSTDRTVRKLASQGRCKKVGKTVTYMKS